MIVYIPTKLYKKAVDNKFTMVDEQSVKYFRIRCMLTGKPIFPRTVKAMNMLIKGENSMVVYINKFDKDDVIYNGFYEEEYIKVEI